MHHSIEPWLWSEMQQKTNLERRCSQVVEELALSGNWQNFRGFEFNDDRVVDNHVYSLCAQDGSFIVDRDYDFLVYRPCTFHEFPLQRLGVDVLQETESQRVVNLKEGANDVVRGLPFEQRVRSHDAISQSPSRVRHLSAHIREIREDSQFRQL
jgi:hypothetical protein